MAQVRHTYHVKVTVETVITIRTNDPRRAEAFAQRQVMNAVGISDYDLKVAVMEKKT